MVAAVNRPRHRFRRLHRRPWPLLAPVAPQPGAAPAPGAPQAPGAQAPAAGAAAQNIGQVQMGMTSEQVQQLLGAPGQTQQKGSFRMEVFWSPRESGS